MGECIIMYIAFSLYVLYTIILYFILKAWKVKELVKELVARGYGFYLLNYLFILYL